MHVMMQEKVDTASTGAYQPQTIELVQQNDHMAASVAGL
jgi:hypothetical protein